MDLLDPLEDYVPPPFSFDIEAATTVRRNEVLSVRGEKIETARTRSGGRTLVLHGPTTKVTVYLDAETTAKLKEAL